MINHELSTNKLIILYMLKTVELPLTNTQLSEFIINKGYTNYFSFQEYLHQLIENDLIRTITSSNSTSYDITLEGEITLEYFGSRISGPIKDEVDEYLKEHRYNIKELLEITSEYIPEKDGDCLVHLVAKENGKILIDLTLNVFDKEYAMSLAAQWKESSHIHYKNILNSLISSIIPTEDGDE